MSKRTKTKGIWRGKILPRLLLMVVPLPKKTFCSIDVTTRCTLRCAHCYFFGGDHHKTNDLDTNKWLELIKSMQSKKAYYSCTWVGGEPLLRKDLIEEGRHFFRSNRVVTNGTLPIPDWPDVEFHISVDGTEMEHDEIRGKGSYAKIKETLSKSPHAKVALACCLNNKNKHTIEPLLKEWHGHPQTKHFLFDFYTPIKDDKDGLWIPFEERDRICDKLIALKKSYGSFIGVPIRTFELMKSTNIHKSVGKNCVSVKNGLALGADSIPKKPCVLGPAADCSKCGCVVPFSVKAWKEKRHLLSEIMESLKK